jgi:8-oxo-dGTP pyrophosphatase MutT (NUDIX family)
MSLAERLRAALAAEHSADLIPHDGMARDWTEDATAAAVLIPVTDRAEPGVILTHRPETMRRHAGQAAFPGGRIDPEDADEIAAALREAEEEIGLSPSLVEIVGAVDAYRTITGYTVTPVIGVIPPDLPLVANPHEVASIFEVPLAFLLDPASHLQVEIDWNGEPRHYWEMRYGEHRIWGATAAMIVNLSRRLSWPL